MGLSVNRVPRKHNELRPRLAKPMETDRPRCGNEFLPPLPQSPDRNRFAQGGGGQQNGDRRTLGHDLRRLGDCRKWNEFEGIPFMVTYHPSYLLHNPSKASKRKVWEDMLLVMEKMEMEISEKQRGFFG